MVAGNQRVCGCVNGFTTLTVRLCPSLSIPRCPSLITDRACAGVYCGAGGTILFDGVDIKCLNTRWMRRQMGYVGQEPVLFDRSVASNISYGLKNVSMDRIVEAAKLAHAHEFISRLPNGYETVVGDRGFKLSGGQKQRVAIARAISESLTPATLPHCHTAIHTTSWLTVPPQFGTQASYCWTRRPPL